MDLLANIRGLTIKALFADDYLFERIVLKGGNALNLVYGISRRTSLDLDFSLEADFDDLPLVQSRIERTLSDRFDSAGYEVFDVQMRAKPVLDGPDTRPWWGGYELTFKLIERSKHSRLAGRMEKMRLDALVIGPRQERVFHVDFSKCEHVGSKIERDFENYTIFVYTLPMIAVEKLRAICQQMPEYALRQGRPRARDFYDIHLVLSQASIDLATGENLELIQSIFSAKQVPVPLLARIDSQREFHRPDWPAVEASLPAAAETFDYYFDFVVAQTSRLQALWNEEPPI